MYYNKLIKKLLNYVKNDPIYYSYIFGFKFKNFSNIAKFFCVKLLIN